MKTCTVTSNVGPPTEFQLPELGDPCSKCHERPSTKEVMIMVERPGGVAYLCDECAAPSPPPETEWTTEPPTEPGWYWRIDRVRPGFPMIPCRVFEADGRLFVHDGSVGLLSETDFLWWPVPIAPPRREP